MLKLNDGRSELWQWDTGRKLTVDADCSQIHFSNKIFGRSIDVDVVDGVAIIPDVLLQTDNDLNVWAFVGTAENGYTKISKVFKVNKRNKPADYVFTPTDQTTLGEILDRIEDLENRPSGDISKEDIQNAVSDYLDKNPVSIEEKDPTVPAWAKQSNPPEQPTALPNPHKLTLTGAVTAEYDGSEAVEVKIPEGGSGGIPIPETAEVGQTIVVKAVDENGKPTEWEAADRERKTKIIKVADITAENDIVLTTDENNDLSFGDAVVNNWHYFYKTPEGNQLRAKKIWGYIYCPTQTNLSASVYCHAYYKDGDPKGEYGDTIANINQGGNIPEKGYFVFMLSSDLGVRASGFVANLENIVYAGYGQAYNPIDRNAPYISGFKIRGWVTLPAGSKFVLKAEVEE